MVQRFIRLHRFAAVLLLVINLSTTMFFTAGAANDEQSFAAAYTGAGFSAIASGGDVNENFDTADTAAVSQGTAGGTSVYLGGTPLGLELKSRGLIIIGKTDVVTKSGLVNPTKDSEIDVGDTILSVDGKEINSAQELTDIVNTDTNKGKMLDCVVKKKSGRTINTKIGSALDIGSGQYRTGLFVRQDSVGIGTLTFVKQDLRFGALGHPVIDAETKGILPISGGRVLGCTVAGSIMGERGKPGELKGIVIKDKVYGYVDKNTKFGLYGYLTKLVPGNISTDLIETLPRTQIKPGKAQIYTTVNGGQPRLYDIEIVKAAYQARPADRSMVIRIVDKELLSQTGGIVQGMSGSPILQGGKLCGAVTHVFINDPTRGYGIYVDWMLDM